MAFKEAMVRNCRCWRWKPEILGNTSSDLMAALFWLEPELEEIFRCLRSVFQSLICVLKPLINGMSNTDFGFCCQGAAKVLIFPVVQQFTEAFVQALQIPDGPTSDSGFKMEVLKVNIYYHWDTWNFRRWSEILGFSPISPVTLRSFSL